MAMRHESRGRNTAPGLDRRWLTGLLIIGVGVAGSVQSAHAACPDGVLDAAEECDDGNRQVGDGCSEICTVEPWILQVCSTARDSSLTLDTAMTLNTYFAAPAAETVLAAGSRVLALGAMAGANVPVRAGDRLMVIQMQGAQINAGAANNMNAPYGDGLGGNDRAGALANTVQAGVYELVVAITNAAGGMVAIRGAGPTGGLVNAYVNSRAVGATQGFQTYQVIRIPQLDNLTLNGAGTVTAAPWNGETGGVAVVDVFGTLTFNGGGIDASARGFRGGQAVTSGDAMQNQPLFPGHKGEGIAGSPRLLFSSVLPLSDRLVTGAALGYPAPMDEGPGAPGNAGGNARQSEDSAGGGGGNGGPGGIGGRGEVDLLNLPEYAGRGGAPYHGPGVIPLGAQRVSMGGGGGGASGDDPFPIPVNGGPPAGPGSGRNGGGVVIVRAAAVAVMAAGGSVRSTGDVNDTASAEGGGGGGAGGTVVLYTNGANLGTLALNASGGTGNNMLEPRDGGGGGGGGGIVYQIATTGGAIDVAGGAGGISMVTGGSFNGTRGTDGFPNTAATAPPNLACEFDRDTDVDGVLDGDDLCPGSDDRLDSDGDGTPDGCDDSGRSGFAGGSCSALDGSGGVPTWFALLAVIGGLALIRRRRRGTAAIGSVCAAALLLPTAARAEIDLDRYAAPAFVDDGIVLSRPVYPGAMRSGLSLSLEYANDPLVFEDRLGDKDSERLAVVSDHLVGHLGGYLGLGRRAMVFAALPVHLAMSGDGPMAGVSADGASVGDPALGARYGLLQRPRFALAAQGILTLPLATAIDSGADFAGSTSVTFLPSLLAEVGVGRGMRLNFTAGFRFRKEAPIDNTRNGSELMFGAGFAAPLYTTSRTAITGHVELSGATGLSSFGSREESPIELLLGAKSRLPSGLSFALAAGPGLQRGVGSPDYRLLATVGWAMPARKPKQPRSVDTRVAVTPPEPKPLECPAPPPPQACPAAPVCPVCPAPRVCPATPTPTTPPPAPPKPIVLLKPVAFAPNADVILQSSFPTLQKVADDLKAHPDLKRIRIEGHTDGDGADDFNLDLSRRRVKSVVKWLVDNSKIDAARLEGYGCGETVPIASNQTVAGKQENRRVDFFVVDPAPATADARDTSKCLPATP